jgi:hypothetical protein
MYHRKKLIYLCVADAESFAQASAVEAGVRRPGVVAAALADRHAAAAGARANTERAPLAPATVHRSSIGTHFNASSPHAPLDNKMQSRNECRNFWKTN